LDRIIGIAPLVVQEMFFTARARLKVHGARAPLFGD
jgi:hypothetical protein